MKCCKESLRIYLQSLFKEVKHLPVCATPTTNRTDFWRKIQMTLRSPSEKKWISWNKDFFRSCRSWHTGEIGVLALTTPNHSSQELIYFTFHSTLLISEKSEKDRKRGEETHTKRGFPCLNGVEKSWMNFSSAGISPSASANCFATGHMAE